MTEIDPIPFKEDFKPSLKYKPYLAVTSISAAIIAYIFLVAWVIVPAGFAVSLSAGLVAFLIPFILIIIFVFVWTQLYYESIVYHLNETEMTWRRGVWFRTTGIVPYNRITHIDIVQGPIMRFFKISNLKIQTAGNSGKNTSEISMIGMSDPEPLRALIMDYVRGTPPVPAATGGIETKTFVSPSKISTANANEKLTAELLEEIKAIRKILEEKGS
ncbi:MAG: PH domain-containing protein [Methanimicrococcus sp.]|nr:PH domain-containing protein [Methanimicrococcus sp.]